MTLEQILKNKGGAVTTMSSSQSLIEAARVLDEGKIGAVVAADKDGSIAGVLSERDITRQLARQAGGALTMSIADAMTRDVIVASPEETVQACLSRMTDRRIRHLPVVREGALIGIVSIGDLVKWKIAETEAEAEAMKTYIATG